VSKKRKRPNDANQRGKLIVEVPAGDLELPKNPEDPTCKNAAAAELRRLGAKKGGHARARALSPQRRKEIAEKAVSVRWAKSTYLTRRQQQLTKELARARKYQTLYPHHAEEYGVLARSLEIRLDEVMLMRNLEKAYKTEIPANDERS